MFIEWDAECVTNVTNDSWPSSSGQSQYAFRFYERKQRFNSQVRRSEIVAPLTQTMCLDSSEINDAIESDMSVTSLAIARKS